MAIEDHASDTGRDYTQAASIDNDVSAERAVLIGVQKFMNTVAGTDQDVDVDIVEATYRALDTVDSIQNRITELEAENEELRNRLDALGDIGQSKTSKEAKIAAVVTYANNLKEPTKGAVTVSPKVIKGVANVSERYAYDLVDDMIDGDGEEGTVGPDGYDWAHDPKKIDQYGSLVKKEQDKGVLIDIEGVHGEPVSMNKFINGSDDEVDSN